MAFWSKLFGGKARDAAEESGPSEDYEGYTITATPYENNGRWQLCGVISRVTDGETKEHRFIRADTFGGRAEAENMTLLKARQIIDQMGERLFAAG